MGVVFARPALPALIARVQSQIAANLAGVTVVLRRSTIAVLSLVFAQEAYQLYAYIDNFAAWFFVNSAVGIYLDRKGAPLGLPRISGTPAVLPVTLNGIAAYVAPAGTVIQSLDSTLTYTLNSAVTMSGIGVGSGNMTCTAPGSAGTLAPGVAVQLAIAVAGINANAVIGAGGTPGTDVETDAAYRVRILARLQQPPQGGAGNDYVTWASALGGVTRCFIYPAGVASTPAGEVQVAVLFDGRVNPIPLSGDLTALAALILPQQPVTATVVAIALTPDAIAVTITNLTVEAGFTLATVEANINANLVSLFASTTAGGATFGTGIPWTTTGGSLALDTIYSAIQESLGVNTFDLTSPTADIASANFHIATLSGGAATIT